MADVKRILRGMPERQPNEESASERQKGYLRSFGYYSEKIINDLGMWQASYLIDEAILIRENESPKNSPKKEDQGRGCGGLIFLLVVCALIIVAVRNCKKDEDEDEGSTQISDSETEIESNNPIISQESTSSKPNVELESKGLDTPILSEEPESISNSLDLATVQYPTLVVATDQFSLLNKEGKETQIAIGTLIKIAKRTELGTLSMEIKGELFVGNESRLAGKIELK